MRKFVACKFRENDIRTFTYHYDVEDGAQEIKPGDRVNVPSKYGTKAVIVVSIGDDEPPFDTKAIIGPVAPSDGGADG